MDELPTLTAGARRNEDIALDLMKFVAMTTGYGRTSSSGVGFQGSGAASKPEEYAGHLLELYGRCLQAVAGGKKQLNFYREQVQAAARTSIAGSHSGAVAEPDENTGHPLRSTYSNHAPAACDVRTASRTSVV